MRWKKKEDWGPRKLSAGQWAGLQVNISAEDLILVEEALEELTGFMEFFRADWEGEPVSGVSDGQLAVVHSFVPGRQGHRELQVVFWATGPVGEATPDAFSRLASASSAFINHLNAEGIRTDSVRWSELLPYRVGIL